MRNTNVFLSWQMPAKPLIAMMSFPPFSALFWCSAQRATTLQPQRAPSRLRVRLDAKSISMMTIMVTAYMMRLQITSSDAWIFSLTQIAPTSKYIPLSVHKRSYRVSHSVRTLIFVPLPFWYNSRRSLPIFPALLNLLSLINRLAISNLVCYTTFNFISLLN